MNSYYKRNVLIKPCYWNKANRRTYQLKGLSYTSMNKGNLGPLFPPSNKTSHLKSAGFADSGWRTNTWHQPRLLTSPGRDPPYRWGSSFLFDHFHRLPCFQFLNPHPPGTCFKYKRQISLLPFINPPNALTAGWGKVLKDQSKSVRTANS